MNTIEELFNKAIVETKLTIPKSNYTFNKVLKNNSSPETIQPIEFEKSLKNFYKSFGRFSKDFLLHLQGQKHIISAFASTPISFSNAWNMKADEISSSDVVSLTKAGGHFQFNQLQNGDESGSNLYMSGFPRGLVNSSGTSLIKGFRHKTDGVYEQDSLSEMGVFTYATPNNSAGMMQYRFAEKFSSTIGIPMVYILTQWFRYDTPFEDNNPWLYMTGVAKVVGNSNHPHDPIELQLITKDEALRLISNLIEVFQTKGDFRIRPPMPVHLQMGWSYDKIKSNRDKRMLIIEYARKNNLRCPGDLCNHQHFSKIKNNKIHIGHRISQNWNSQNMGVADVHHPYNLYLSCDKCNISLSDKYPNQIDEIINHMGTIGDWLMKDLRQ